MKVRFNKHKFNLNPGVLYVIALFIIILILHSVSFVESLPSSNIFVISNSSDSYIYGNASNYSSGGGTISTIVFNASQQTQKWKAYVGNVTGSLALRNSLNYTLYDWNLANTDGEIYASRNGSIIWADINCSNITLIQKEQQLLGFTDSIDSINNTFNHTVHRNFITAGANITNSSCPSIATYVNNSRQLLSENSIFQEVLLMDKYSLVYTSLLENNQIGYNNKSYDFQIIVADYESTTIDSGYYFYIELG